MLLSTKGDASYVFANLCVACCFLALVSPCLCSLPASGVARATLAQTTVSEAARPTRQRANVRVEVGDARQAHAIQPGRCAAPHDVDQPYDCQLVCHCTRIRADVQPLDSRIVADTMGKEGVFSPSV